MSSFCWLVQSDVPFKVLPQAFWPYRACSNHQFNWWFWFFTTKKITAIGTHDIIIPQLTHLFCPHFVGKFSTSLWLCVWVPSLFGRKNLRQSDGLHFISDFLVFCRVESWGTLTCGTCWVPSLKRENFHEGTPYSRRIYAWQEILLPRRRGDLHDRLWIPPSEYGDIRNSFSTRPILCNNPYIVSLIVQSSSTSEADDARISPS